MWYHWLIGALCIWSLATYIYRRASSQVKLDWPGIGDVLWFFVVVYGTYWSYKGITAPPMMLVPVTTGGRKRK